MEPSQSHDSFSIPSKNAIPLIPYLTKKVSKIEELEFFPSRLTEPNFPGKQNFFLDFFEEYADH